MSKRRMADFAHALGARIAMLRVQAGLSQDALAARLDSAKSVLSRIENGGAIPSLNRIVELAEIFRVEVREFFVFGDAGRTDDKAEWAGQQVALLVRQLAPDDIDFIVGIVGTLARKLRK